MPRITRRNFIACLALSAAGVAGYASVIEPKRVDVTRHLISGRGFGSIDGHTIIRLVQLSDIHLQEVDGHARTIARITNELEPDVVVLTGDVVDKPGKLSELRRFLSLLDDRSSKFATLGNWEHWARIDFARLSAAYEQFGCRLLINETAVYQQRGHEVLFTGLDDWTGGQPDLGAALQDVPPRAGHILLAHSPGYRDVLARTIGAENSGSSSPSQAVSRHSVDCVLSGHTHGGQIVLFGRAPIRPAGSGPYLSGWYRESWPPLYVSRGLGTSVVPVRFGATPEIAYFEWTVAGV